ncbi:MAG: N-glycosylase/DNA lyase [archaeon]|nr:N-glycosylase/DNA lyase [archaeon]MCP8314052.1 N-glycosylase/DNA lyase [archaeon]MCP8316146.1 N-glycosylase/DNA lyase [archaeon]MCP8320857.1 N-glycosylase/DNA lyase [archaeon]
MSKDLSQLIKAYQIKKDEIQRRLSEFKGILNESDGRVFAELAFCLCTPQSRATTCWEIILSLMGNGLLFKGNEDQIRPFLNAIRFGDNKAKYIVKARRFFTEDGNLRIKEKILSFDDLFKLREWLVEKILGIGMKEASHFLRNIGLSKDLAILDRHILKNLKEYGVIKEIPKSITKKVYIDIENKMREFSKRIKIPMDELDLLLWSKETGIVFK